jgi:hypothetical protein
MGVYLSIWLIELIHLHKKDQKKKLWLNISHKQLKYINNKIWDCMWPWHLYIHPKHFDMEFKHICMQLFNIYIFDCKITYIIKTCISVNTKYYSQKLSLIFSKFYFKSKYNLQTTEIVYVK